MAAQRPKRFIPGDELEFQGHLSSGEGVSATVHEAKHRGSNVAVKVFKSFSPSHGETDEQARKAKAKMQEEVNVLEKIPNHPNLVLYMGANLEDARPFVVTELSPFGDLEKFLNTNPILPVTTLLKMSENIAAGLNYLHLNDPPIIHLDLKPENLLVFHNDVIKIADFGLSRIMENHRSIHTMGTLGTAHYMAPECFAHILRRGSSARMNGKSDVFSLGCVLYRMFAGCRPFEELKPRNPVHDPVIAAVQFLTARERNRDYRPAFPFDADIPQGMEDLIRDCWKHEADQRPTMEVVLQRIQGILQEQPASTSTAPRTYTAPPPPPDVNSSPWTNYTAVMSQPSNITPFSTPPTVFPPLNPPPQHHHQPPVSQPPPYGTPPSYTPQIPSPRQDARTYQPHETPDLRPPRPDPQRWHQNHNSPGYDPPAPADSQRWLPNYASAGPSAGPPSPSHPPEASSSQRWPGNPPYSPTGPSTSRPLPTPSSQRYPPDGRESQEYIIPQAPPGPLPHLPTASGPPGPSHTGEHWQPPLGGEMRPSSSGREGREEERDRQLKRQYSALDWKEVTGLRKCFERADVEHRGYITIDQAYRVVGLGQGGEHGLGLLGEHLLSLLKLQQQSQRGETLHMEQLFEMACTAKGKEGDYPFLSADQVEALKQQFSRLDVDGDGRLTLRELKRREKSSRWEQLLEEQLRQSFSTHFTENDFLRTANTIAHIAISNDDKNMLKEINPGNSMVNPPPHRQPSPLRQPSPRRPRSPRRQHSPRRHPSPRRPRSPRREPTQRPTPTGPSQSSDSSFQRHSSSQLPAEDPPNFDQLAHVYRGVLTREMIENFWALYDSMDVDKDRRVTFNEIWEAHRNPDSNHARLWEQTDMLETIKPYLLAMKNSKRDYITFEEYLRVTSRLNQNVQQDLVKVFLRSSSIETPQSSDREVMIRRPDFKKLKDLHPNLHLVDIWSLWGLFCWLDEDGDGKVSSFEIAKALLDDEAKEKIGESEVHEEMTFEDLLASSKPSAASQSGQSRSQTQFHGTAELQSYGSSGSGGSGSHHNHQNPVPGYPLPGYPQYPPHNMAGPLNTLPTSPQINLNQHHGSAHVAPSGSTLTRGLMWLKEKVVRKGGQHGSKRDRDFDDRIRQRDK